MKKCELLSPAGNMEMLKYAVSYGADAIYLAGNKFGARKFATNFNDEELIEAIKYAHLYGVKVYLTINTLIYDEEIPEFIKYVEFVHRNGIDAVLVQDFGMLNLLHNKFPNLELHASTQMHNNSKEMTELLKKYGVTRVVLDREMSLNEIKNLPKDIEKEVFCHGALCVSYSGQCLFSSLILNRSGNRGECAGMCRLPYKLESNGKVLNKNPLYYLSLKDLCTVNQIDKIIESGVDCLKIEGRMKSPEYVGYMTKIYRKLIDSYYEGTFTAPTKDEMKNIKLLFNRGLTKGFINDEENDNMGNKKSPNHIGIPLGKYKVQNNKIEIYLEDDLTQGDAIRFTEENKGMTVNFLYNAKNKLINSAKQNEKVYIDNFLDLEKSGEVRKVGSINLNKEVQNLPIRKVKINGTVTIKRGQKMVLEISDYKNDIIVRGNAPETAINRKITKEEVFKQINKTGNTIYIFDNLKIDIDDNLFVNVKDLNELRREALLKLNEKRSKNSKEIIVNEYKIKIPNLQRNFEINVIVNTKEQYEVAKKYKVNIFIDNENLCKELKDDNAYIRYSEKKTKTQDRRYIIGDYGSLINKNKDDFIHTDYMLNVTNVYSLENLINLNAKTICLSPEMNINQIIKLQNEYPNSYIEVLVYGKLELMKMKYNPVDMKGKNYLIDRNNKKYYIKEKDKLYYLMNYEALDLTCEIDKLVSTGIKNFRIDFLDETKETCEKILANIHKKLFKE